MSRVEIDGELFLNAFKNLRRQGIRTYLTTIGIVIGIAAVVALLMVGEGLNLTVQEEFEKMGSNTIMVMPGSSFMQSTFSRLESGDADKIKAINGVEDVFSINFVSMKVERGEDSITAIIMGVDPNVQEGMSQIGMLEVGEGRGLVSTDKYSVLIGKRFSENAFEKEIGLKQRLLIGGKNFRIIGITKEGGSSFGSMFDNAIVMPTDTLEEAYGEELYPFRIIVRTFSKDDVAEVSDRITRVLKRAHGQEDFQVMAASQIQEVAASVLGLVQLVLVGIASISLIVGGIGIMNTMLMSVMERTRDIGIMKAIGATNKRIRNMFLIEAGLIGAVGGVIGLILGFLIAVGVGIAAQYAGFALKIVPNPLIFAGAVAFAMIVGMAAGYLPAKRAAQMDPVIALGHE